MNNQNPINSSINDSHPGQIAVGGGLGVVIENNSSINQI